MSDMGVSPGEPLDSGAALVRAGEAVAELLHAAGQADAAMARLVGVAGELLALPVEQREGMTVEQVLIVQARMRATDARLAVTAAEVLAMMPVLRCLLADGQVSWSVVREIVFLVRGFGRSVREAVDAELAATRDRYGDLCLLDPDDLCAAVGDAVERLRVPASAQRSEERRRQGNVVRLQRASTAASAASSTWIR